MKRKTDESSRTAREMASEETTGDESAGDESAGDESAGMKRPEVALEEALASKETGVEASQAVTPSGATTGELVSAASVDADVDAGRERQGVVRSAGVVSLAVMGSRLMGLVRDQLFAYFFGAGFLKDAFLVGFRLPNMLRDLFAEGALSAAFVKTFTDYLEREGATAAEREEAAWRLASMLMNALVVVLSLLTLVGIIFSPQLVALMAPGFAPEKARLAATLTRIMFPFIIFVALAAVAMGVLNTKGRFAVPASATTLFNIGSIIFGLLLAYSLSGGSWNKNFPAEVVPDAPAQWAMTGMAIGTLIGGALQFLLQVPALRQVGFRFRFALSFTDQGVRRVMRLMLPAIIGTAATQVNVFVNTFYASSIDGGASWLDFSFRLMQLPIGIFGVAIGMAATPAIARFAARGDLQSFRRTLSSSINLVFLLTIPSACGLIILRRPIIALIFERGAFTKIDTEMVAAALAFYAVGLAGYAAIKILSPAFYALADARTPMLASLVSIALNAVADYFFLDLFSSFGVTPSTPNGYGHAGLALSTSAVALLNFLVLLFLMRRRLRRLEGRRILSSFARITLAAIALSIASHFSYKWLVSIFGDASTGARFVEAFVPILVGGSVFFAVAALLRVPELKEATEALASRFRR